MASSSSSSSPPIASSPGDAAATAELDLTGEVCPFTFVRTRLALEPMPLGARLRVLVDHPPAATNIPRSAVAWGQEVVRVDPVDTGAWAIEIIKRVE